MHSNASTDKFFQSKVLGHPAGLFVLFFTEMWERFSFYGMRVLLVLFLTMSFIGTNPGWEFASENAGALYGTYAGLLYLTPIVGGILADKFLGYRLAVVTGALIMTLGHACMALETEFSLYFGLGLLVVGTGFFKPNITSIISQMYKDLPKKKDGAYTIFYMGVNAGAFFGMMLCGYVGEKIGWTYGFGLAGIFMLLGAIQFWLSKPLFGTIGEKPLKESKEEKKNKVLDYVPNKFTVLDRILIMLTATVGLIYLINDPLSKIGGIFILPEFVEIGASKFNGSMFVLILFGLIPFLYLCVSRILRYNEAQVRTRMFAVIVFALFTMIFFLCFEQGATSLVLFADDYTDRILDGSAATTFNIVNIILTLGPLVIITWVLYRLFLQTWAEIKWSNIALALTFAGVWGLAIWMINRDLNTKAYNFQAEMIKYPKIDEEGKAVLDEKGNQVYAFKDFTESSVLASGESTYDSVRTFNELIEVKNGQPVQLIFENGKYELLDEAEEKQIRQQVDLHKRESPIIHATCLGVKSGSVEISASWFSILNSFFIIAFASFFSRWWESKYNPSPALKFTIGLLVIALGFGVMAYGSMPIGDGTAGIRVNMIWLIMAYFFHTLGELCISPVGLSMVSKLVPARMIGFMFGMWYLAIAIGNKVAASLGGAIDGVVSEYNMTVFFLSFTFIAAIPAIIIFFLNPVMKRLMKGVE